MTTPNILFLCTGNSCRSQMAEAWTRELHSGVLHPYSAGVLAKGLDPRAVQAMKEQGIDISTQHSKLVSALLDEQHVVFQYVITVCDNAAQQCPAFPGRAKVIHHEFDDPPALTKEMSDEEEKRRVYRRVCLEIKAYIQSLPSVLHL